MKLPILASLPLIVAALVPFQAASQETIVAYSNGEKETTINGYNKDGAGQFHLKLPAQDSQGIVSGRWNASSHTAVIVGQGNSAKFRIHNNNGSIANEIALPNEPINTIFGADYNNNGYTDLVIMVHSSNKAKALMYFDPGFYTSTPYTINMPQASLYYAPAIAGTTAIGILAYQPETAKAAPAKRKKSKNKNKKPKKPSKAGTLQIIDGYGNVVKSIAMKNPADGQVHPFSPDGQCGFAIQNGNKLKAYRYDGSLVKEIQLSSENPAALGNFSGGSNLEEILVPETVGVSLINITTGQRRSVSLTGLPNQQEVLQAEIDRLSDDLILAYQTGAPVSEILEIRDEIFELHKSKQEITTAANVSSRLFRLFTGGVGAIEGVCDAVDETPNDGYGGFLVKNGDFTGKIVILTPGGKDYRNGEILKMGSYKVMQKLTDSGYGNPDSNGSRKHFRGNGTVQSIGKFVFRASIQESFISDKIKRQCWFITKPASRID